MAARRNIVLSALVCVALLGCKRRSAPPTTQAPTPAATQAAEAEPQGLGRSPVDVAIGKGLDRFSQGWSAASQKLQAAGVEGGLALERSHEQEDVEISPDVFITVDRWQWLASSPAEWHRDVRSRLAIPYRGQTVEWQGPGIPQVLREQEGKLYLVVFGNGPKLPWAPPPQPRRTPQLYYRQEGSGFVQIRPEEFPKRIATKNLGVLPNHVPEELEWDKRPGFIYSPTAYIWAELLTGKVQETHEVDQQVIREYIRRYDPIKLTRIRRDVPLTQPVGTPATRATE